MPAGISSAAAAASLHGLRLGGAAPGGLGAHRRRDPRAESSMPRMILACGMVPTLNWIRKRSWPKSSCWKRILSTTSCGLPTSSAPRGERSASNCARVVGGQPRSRPMRVITSA